VPETVVAALERTVAEESDGHILASAIRSAFTIFQCSPTFEKRINAMIDDALMKGNEYTLHAASELLGYNANDLPSPLIDLLLTQLLKINPKNYGTIKNIDYGISNLINRDDPGQGLHFLEKLLISQNGNIKIKALDSVSRGILKNSVLLSKIITRWFLRSERLLWDAVHDIVESHHGTNLHIEIDASEIKTLDLTCFVFISRKAIGYFFLKPVTAASILISLLRHAPDDQTRQELGGLLFDPLLLNYPGCVRDYLQEQATQECSAVQETIQAALTNITEYMETLSSIPNLPALKPGQAQRETYRRHMSESMTESMKSAEKKSIFSNLFTRSTLLYGNKSINYIYANNDDAPRRMEVALNSHNISMELPRMGNIDPFSLDYMVRIFRLERIRA
jgi:hypothetical protein